MPKPVLVAALALVVLGGFFSVTAVRNLRSHDVELDAGLPDTGIDPHPPATVEVSILRARPRRFVVETASCAVEGEQAAAAQPVRAVFAHKNRVWACPDRKANKRTAGDACVWRQDLELACEVPARIRVGRSAPTRYGNHFSVRVRRGRLVTTTRIDLEQYVDGVVYAEHRRAPFVAQQVQAIVARTFAAHTAANPRHETAPICDSTHCQAYTGGSFGRQSPAQATAGLVLVDDNGTPSQTFFHSACGGETQDAADVWPGTDADAIVGVKDVDSEGHAWCKASRSFRWRFRVSDRKLAVALRPVMNRTPHAGSLSMKALDSDALRWRIRDRRGSKIVRVSKIHKVLGRAFGFTDVRSSWFRVKRRRRTMTFFGRGSGHRVGMCQKGASARAEAGQTSAEILEAYFPRLQVELGTFGERSVTRRP